MGPNRRPFPLKLFRPWDQVIPFAVLQAIMRKPFDDTGFTPPARHPLGAERRTVALAELVAIAALAVSTIVLATVVSAGIARANVADGVVGNEGSLFGIALLLGLFFIGVGGLSLPGRRPKRH
jgi:hypothetical protein